MASTSSSPPVLSSWKEIASFFGKGTRTVQRWERNFALPVRRPIGKPLGMVSASTADLEHWWASQWLLNKAANGILSPPPSADVAGLHKNIEQAQKLRYRNHQLSDELHRRLKEMQDYCASMVLKLEDDA
jgi:hypothetical protein